jgi:hypothetical protein
MSYAPRVSRYGFFTINSAGRGRADDTKLQNVLNHSKRKPKGPISLAPVRSLSVAPAPTGKVERAEKKGQPKSKASKRGR